MQRLPTRHLTVIVPALDEAPCIGTVLEGLLRQPGVDDVLVVDGGSRDGTVEIARSLGVPVHVQSAPGFGRGLWEAFDLAQGDVCCIVDADGSGDWRDLPRMRAKIDEGYDFVLGSRYRGAARWRGLGRWPFSTSDDDSWVHEWGNLGIVALCKLLHGYPLSDVMMGLQMWRREVLDGIQLTENSQAFEAEFKLAIHHAGFRMTEISTHEHARLGGEAKLDAFRDGVATARVILSRWWRHRVRRSRRP